MNISFITRSSSLFLLLLISLVYAQDAVPGTGQVTEEGTLFTYHLYDLSSQEQADELTAVFNNFNFVQSFRIDLEKHAVLVTSKGVIEEGSQAWVDFNAPIRQALKDRGYVYIRPQDLARFYPQ